MAGAGTGEIGAPYLINLNNGKMIKGGRGGNSTCQSKCSISLCRFSPSLPLPRSLARSRV